MTPFLYLKNRIEIKTISILVVLFSFSVITFSQSDDDVRNFAAGFLNTLHQNRTGLKSTVPASSLVQAYESRPGVKTPVYVFSQADNGFAVVAKSNNTLAVIGYSDENSFNGEDIPPQLKSMLAFYEDSLSFYNPLTSKLKAGTPVVEPLLYKYGINLNQYNHPEVGGSYTGCMATAFTQIMLYHAAKNNTEVKGYGSHCYTHDVYGEICADFDTTTYDDPEILSYHVAVSMDMIFSPELPGSSPPIDVDINGNLEKYFRFYVKEALREPFYIESELNNERPVYIAIPGEPVGHAVVVDGYDDQGYLHLNFGWGGSSNGYYMFNGSKFSEGMNTFTLGFADVRIASPVVLPVNNQDSLALVAVYNALGGSQVLNWDMSKPVWDWGGVTVMNGRVIRLNLPAVAEPQTQQSIAPEIGELSELQELYVSGCLNGTIPSTITNLSNLKELHISNGTFYSTANQTLYKGNMESELPDDIGNMTNLEGLSIRNALTGNIPASIGNLANLRYVNITNDTLNFGKGGLTGNIPDEMGNLSKLTQLTISDQSLTGSVPGFVNNLPELVSIDLSGNRLSGELAALSLPKLEFLWLKDNSIASLPEGDWNCPALKDIKLENNEIEGKIPQGFGYLTSLSTLNLSNNKITELPEEMSRMIRLESLDVDNNDLEALPDGLSLLIHLKHLSAKNNRISYLPDGLGLSRNLVYVDLSFNKITTIPEGFAYCNQGRVIMNDNNIDSIPGSFAEYEGSDLYLQNNFIKGKIPLSILTDTAEYGSRNIRLDNNSFVFNDIPESNSIKFGVRNQKTVELSKKLFKVQIGDTVKIDIRDISTLSHTDNEYYWMIYPYLTEAQSKDERFGEIANDPVLTFVVNESNVNDKYYCKVFNPQVPEYTYTWNGYTYTSPCLDYLNTDTIVFELATDKEIIAENYPDKFVTSLSSLSSNGGSSVSDRHVTLVPPLKVKRGKVLWQVSADSVSWVNVTEDMADEGLKANIDSVTDKELLLLPKTTAFYRCCIKESDCDTLYSEALKVKALGNVLFDEVINVEEDYMTVSVDSIEVIVPRGFHKGDFRLTISKIDNPPACPDTVIAGSAYDVSVDFPGEFNLPLLIKLKNIDKSKIDEKEINRFKAVYFDDAEQKWKPYDQADASLSLKDSCMVLSTNHLTKLSWWWDEENFLYGFTDYYERNNIRVFYKDEDLNFMKFIYGKKQTAQPWHVGGYPLMVQDITEYLPKVIAKYKALGLDTPSGTFKVYVQDIENGDAGCVGILGMFNGYMKINKVMYSPADLRSTLAHEFMHYTQDYYISAHNGNVFWMEAHATLADMIVWSRAEVPVYEPEEVLLNGRTSKNLIFDFLSKPWDYYDNTVLTNSTDNIHYDYMAGTFMHYMQACRSGDKLEPATLLKETSWLGSWRAYLANYVSKKLSSDLGDEYEDYIKYILSMKDENFTLLNNEEGENPYSYLESPNSKKNFATYIKYKFKDEDDEQEQKDEIGVEVPYLSAKIVLLNNLTEESMVVVNYKRKHNADDKFKVYYVKYNVVKHDMDFVDISDSTEYNFLLDARNKENATERFANYGFLLLVNKKYSFLSSVRNDFDASFELTAQPVLNIESVGKLDIYNGSTPVKHHFDNKYDYIPFGWFNDQYLRNVTGFVVRSHDRSVSKQMLDDVTVQIVSKYTQAMNQGITIGQPTMKDSTIYTQTITYELTTGIIKITERKLYYYFMNPYYEYEENDEGEVVGTKLITPGYKEYIDDNTKTYWLKGVTAYSQKNYTGFESVYGENIKVFKTANTAETTKVVEKIEAVCNHQEFDAKGNSLGVETSTYVSTDFTDPNLYLWFVVRISEE